MDWTEIIVQVAIEDLERAEGILHMVTNLGLYTEDYTNIEKEVLNIAHVDLIEESLLNRDRTQALIHVYFNADDNPVEQISNIQEKFDVENIPISITIQEMNEEDWANNWKKFFKPFKVGKNVIIKPEWEELKDEDWRGDETVLQINPGMAFGTGSHASTKLCIMLMEEYLKPEATVLDLGTGSGILSVASVLLGAQSAFGVDIDTYAVRTAEQNAQLNSVEGKTKFRVGDLTNGIDGKFDIVFANIIADIIIRLSGIVADYMKNDGVLICSGIIDSRENDVIEAIRAQGLVIEKLLREDVWTALAVRKM